MIYWLAANIALGGLTFWSYKAIGHGDDFGSAVYVILLGSIGGISTFTYLATAVWLHRFI